MLENDSCDESCYNLQCNYDNQSCDDICYDWMLGNSICETQCNTAEFRYDEWDCTCSPHCLEDMVSNQVCNPECFIEDCNYDGNSQCYSQFKHCREGCFVDYSYQYCNIDCLSWNCNYYDNQQCDPRIKTHAFYRQLISKDLNSSVDIYSTCLKDASNDMIDGKTAYCTLQKLGDQICHTECNTEECAYDLGDCSYDCHPSCDLCFEAQNEKKCLRCSGSSYLLYTVCFSACPYGFVPSTINNVKVCTLSPEYLKSSVEQFYIIQETGPIKEPQNGKELNPFSSISDSFAHVRGKTVFITLLNYDDSYHLLKPVNMEKFPAAEILSWNDRPLDFDGFINVTDLYITAAKCEFDEHEYCYEKNAVLKWNSLKAIQIDVTGGMFIINIDLYGYNPITVKPCPLNEYFQYCTYCQNVMFDYDTYTNSDDHGEEITWKYAQKTDCERYKDSTLFKVAPQGHLVMIDCKIYDWRAGFSSIISNHGGIIELTSVKFENIIISSEANSAVILSIDCPKNSYRCGAVSIYNCEVFLLNNGYEYDPNHFFSGFIYAKGLYSFILSHSILSFNLSYKGYNTIQDTAVLGSLIILEDFLTVDIDSTLFSNNISENLIYLDMGTLYSQEYNTYLNSYDPNLDHVKLTNLTFTENYGGLITVQLENELPNFSLNGIQSVDNISSRDLISIHLKSYRDTWQHDRIKQIIIDSVRTEYVLHKRVVILSDISFLNSYTPTYILSFHNLGNLNITSLSIQHSVQHPQVEYSYMEYMVYSKFRDYPASYIQKTYTYQDLLFNYSISAGCYMKGIRGLVMNKIDIIENFSNQAGPCIEVIQPLDIVEITEININRNVGNGERAVLGLSIVDYSSDIMLSQIYASYNENSHLNSYGVIYLVASNDCHICTAQLKDSVFQNNSAGYGGAVSSVSSGLYIDNVEFESNLVTSGYGGGLYLDIRGQSQYLIEILNCSFTHNQVKSGKGGAIAIDNSQNTGNSLSLSIGNSDFSSNISLEDSSTIYISSSVKLSQTSFITNCNFTRNTSKGKGSIYLEYYQGVLTINQCNFIENEGQLGIAIYSSIDKWKISTDEICQLIMNHCTFEQNKSLEGKGSVIHIPDTGVYSKISSSYCVFRGNEGTTVHLEYGEWVDNSSTFVYNKAYSAPVLNISNNAYAFISLASIENNSSMNSAGVIELSGESAVNLTQSTVRYNHSNINGGVIFMEQKSLIAIQNCQISENTAEVRGSVLYSIGCDKPGSYISDTKIHQNQSKQGGSIYLLSSYLNVTLSELYGNTDSSISPGIVLNLSVLNMFYSSIYDQYGHAGAGIYSTTSSTIYIYSSTFTSLDAESYGGFIYSFSSSIMIVNSTVENTSAVSGGSILAYSDSILTIINTEIYNSRSIQNGGIIKAQGSDVIVLNCEFSEFGQNGIEGNSLKSLDIRDSKFNNGVGKQGGSILCDSCEKITIRNSTFEMLSADIGGAIYATTDKDELISTSLEITSSRFIGNKAYIGGAVYVDNLNLTISDSYFNANLAYSPSQYQISHAEGGAIAMQCSDFPNCIFELRNNSFYSNHAESSGGAIWWRHIKPSESNNTYINNTALYGNDIATFPISLKLLEKYGNNFSGGSRVQIQLVIGELEEVAPGQPCFPIRIALLDMYNNTVANDSTSLGEISSDDPLVILSGKTKVLANKGVFEFEDYTISSKPGTSVSIIFTTEALSKENFKGYSIKTPRCGVIWINLRSCIMGEKTTEDKCIKCPNNTYSIDPTDNECMKCPQNAVCYGEYYLVPKPGYWRTGIYSNQIFECHREDACLGSKNYPDLNFSGICREGYEGNLCQGCSIGYSRASKDTCGKCPHTDYNTWRLILSALGLTLGVVWIVRATMKSVYKPKSMNSICIKIFINYLHPISIVAGFNLEWPEYAVSFLSFQENAGSMSDQILSIDCLLHEEGYFIKAEELYYFKLGLMFILPFIMVILAFIFWGSIALYHKKSNYLKNELVATIIILLFLVHPNVVNYMFHAFSCMEIEEGEYWLLNNMQVKCWSEEHKYYAMNIALPGIISWGIAIPAICLILLIKYQKKLNEVTYRLKFGFLFNGYKSKYYYWEFIILYKKILIITMSVFLVTASVNIQALTAITVLLAGFYLQSKHNPYDNDELNRMELRSILVAVITIYCGLFYMSRDLNINFKIVLFIIILLANAYFLGYLVKKLIHNSWRDLLRKLPCLKKKLGYGEKPELVESLSFLSNKTGISASQSSQKYSIEPSNGLSEPTIEPYHLNSLNLVNMKHFYILITKRKNTIDPVLSREATYSIQDQLKF